MHHTPVVRNASGPFEFESSDNALANATPLIFVDCILVDEGIGDPHMEMVVGDNAAEHH